MDAFSRRLAHSNRIFIMKNKLTLSSLCLLLGLVSPLAAADLRLGLVGYYQMDALDGINLPDATPYSNHMRAVNFTGGSFAAGQFGNAVQFNNSSMYATNLHSPDPAATGLPIYRAGAYTITMWVKAPPVAAKYLYTEGNTTTTTP